MSLDNEYPVPTDRTKEERKSYNLLPRFYRTDSNKKFLSATVDQLTSPGTIKKVSGNIGRTNAKSVKSSDTFIEAPYSDRQNYQLEPSLVIEDRFGNVNFFKDYIDHINHIKVLNGITDNHERLNKQEFYSWNPHIDWDKFVNFQQYYWLPYGPDPIQVIGQQLDIDSTYTVSLEDQGDVFAYLITPDGLTRNPSLTLYRGQTYRFDIDSPNHPFSLKTLRTTGFNNRYTNNTSIVSANAVTEGTIIFKVPVNAPDVLYYVSETDPNVGGEMVIKNIEENTFFDVEKELLGKKYYSLPNGFAFSNGMKLEFLGKTNPEIYQSGYWIVEGIGSAIRLINLSDLEIIGQYTEEKNLLFDNDPFDQTPFSTQTSVPKSKDYILFKRASLDGNPWSKVNRWFHQDVISKTAEYRGTVPELDQSARATRPIIEFDNDIKLYNFGHVSKKSVDLIDNITTDVFSTIEGSLGYNIDGVDLVDGMRILFTSDTDRLVNGRIYQVKFLDITLSSRDITFNAALPDDSTGAINLITDTVRCETDHGLINGQRVVYLSNGNIQLQGLTHRQIYYVKVIDERNLQLFTDYQLSNKVDITALGDGTHSFEVFEGLRKQITLIETEDSVPQKYETVLVKQGSQEALTYNGSSINGNQGLMYWYDGTKWLLGQVKFTANQPPVFDIFDNDGYSYSDVSVYNGSSFNGTKLFSYQVGEGSLDNELGFSLSYKNINNIGDIVFNFNLLLDSFYYKSGTTILTKTTNIGFLKKIKSLDDYVYLNGWINSKVENIQPIVRIFKDHDIDGLSKGFPIDVFDEFLDLSDLKVKVYINSQRLDSSSFEVRQGTVRKEVYFKSKITNTDIVTLRLFSKQPKNDNGYYEIPLNLQNNPLNNNLESFTLGQVIDHVFTIVDNISTFEGQFPGNGNLRDISDLSKFGTRFVQHSSPLNFALYNLGTTDFNIFKALDVAKEDYGKFKTSFLVISSEIGVETEPKQMVDLILNELNKDKPKSNPWFLSDMFAYTANTKFSYTVLDERIKSYPLKNSFTLDNLSNKSVLVYLNNNQLLHGKDYKFLGDFFEIFVDLAENDIIEVYEYETTDGSFCPPTPTKLGLYPLYEPKKYIDNTYLIPTTVIQGHDGSITVGFGDYRDDVLLELEKRIFNNIKIRYDRNIFDIYDFIPGHGRVIEYSKEEHERILSQFFYHWTTSIQNDYMKFSDFLWDVTNRWTYNYRGYEIADKTSCPAFWRGIYKWLLDTDRPHSHPWECLGFSIEPTWWKTVYGSAPYTKDNFILWDDIKDGIIREPGKTVKVLSKFAKPILSYGNPVDEYGNLLDPIISGFVNGYVQPTQKGYYVFGDQAPVETAWRRSSYHSFSLLQTAMIMNPSKVITLAFDRSRIVRNFVGQLVYSPTNLRIRLKDLVLPTTVVSDNRVFTSGLVNYVVNNFSPGLVNPLLKYKASLDSIINKISYRVGGFTNKDKFKIILTSKNPSSTNGVFLPSENYKVFLNKSSPLKNINYSGIVITKFDDGYEVRGYTKNQPYFKYYLTLGRGREINVGGISESYINWETNQRYQSGTIVYQNKSYYRVKVTHTSSSLFDTDLYVKLPSLPIIGGKDIILPESYDTRTEHILSYGTKFYTIQEVVNFIGGYGKYLQEQGFVFDRYNTSLKSVENWDTSIKEFVFWTTQNWKTGSALSLSPSAISLTFTNDYAVVDNISDTFYGYQIFRVDGSLLEDEFLNSFRENNEFTLTVPANNPHGIYGANFRTIQKEHIVLLDNVSLFNDVIYDVESGYKHDKLKIQGYVSTNWNGGFNIPGFIYDQAKIQDWEVWTDYNLGDIVFHKDFYYSAKTFLTGTAAFNSNDWYILKEKPNSEMLPNWDYKTEQFNDFYDLDSDNFDIEQQKIAQHLIGYQKRQYLENIVLDDISQYKFYQGYIKEKGTLNSFSKLFDVLSADNQESLSFNEEWAIRLGTYGNISTYEEIEFNLNEEKILLNPQPFELTETDVVKPDFVYRVKGSEIYIKPIEYKTNLWPTSVKKEFLRTPGYVRYDDVSASLDVLDEILSLDIEDFNEGSYVWCAFLESQRKWTVYRLTHSATRVEKIEYNNSVLSITLDSIPNMYAGQIIGIDNVTLINGFYKIDSISGKKINIKKTIPEWKDDLFPDSTATLIYIFTESRVNHIDQLNDVIPERIKSNELVWIDDNGYGKKTVLEYKKVYNINTINGLDIPRNNENFGRVVAVSQNGMVSAVGDIDTISIFFKNTKDNSFVQQQIIKTFYDDSTQLGLAVALSPDTEWLVLSETKADLTNSVHFYIKDSTLGTYQYFSTFNKPVTSYGTCISILYSDNTYYTLVTSSSNLYSYKFVTNQWVEIQSISVSSTSLATNGTVTVLGDKNTNSVKIYKKVSDLYSLTQTLTLSNLFGYSVAITSDGKKIAVGEIEADNPIVNSGLVKIYKLVNDVFVFQQDVVSKTPGSFDYFGYSIFFMNNDQTLVVLSINGDVDNFATFDNDNTIFDNNTLRFNDIRINSGRVDVFDKFFENYSFGESLSTDQFTDISDGYGFSLAVGDDTIIVSAINEEEDLASNAGKVFSYTKFPKSTSWKIKYIQEDNVDISKFKKSYLYDTEFNQLLKYIDIVDTTQGKIPGPADQEIKFKTFYDPAVYSIGTSQVIVDEGQFWSKNYVGTLWWDLSRAKFIENSLGNITYRSTNWNKLYKTASIDVYEWVETKYKPSEWDTLSGSDKGDSLGISGTSRYGNSVYSLRQVYDNVSQSFKNVYYYWVKNPTIVPLSVVDRKLSANNVSKLIADPIGYGYECMSLIGSNSFILVNLINYIKSKKTNLNIEYFTVDEQYQNSNLHSHWKLLSTHEKTIIPPSIELKWEDSLIGYDQYNRQIPSLKLPPKKRYGISNRPRQSMFINRIEALKQFVERVNLVLKGKVITDEYDISDLNNYDIPPSSSSGIWDKAIDIVEEQRFINTALLSQATVTPIIESGRIIEVKIVNPGYGYVNPPWVKVVGSGIGAKLRCVIDTLGQVTSVEIINAGKGYIDDTILSVRSYTVLVKNDEVVFGTWSLYEYSGTGKFFRIKSQSYDVKKYWDYIDWYLEGYNQYTKINHLVENTNQLYLLESKIGDIVKVETIGSGGWLLLEKYNNVSTIDYTKNYKVIGRQNGTIQINSGLYDFTKNIIGYDGNLYDSFYYDNLPVKELRIILNVLKKNILVDDLYTEYLELFFSSLRYVLYEQPFVDYITKTSFIKSKHNLGELKQKITYKNDNLENFEDYIKEVKPYRTKIREYVSSYSRIENSGSVVTDFDLPSYVDENFKLNVVNFNIFDDSTTLDTMLNSYPWKFFKDNVGCYIKELVIVDSGSGYLFNPIIKINGQAKKIAKANGYIAGGKLNRIQITDAGSGYLTTPLIEVDGGLSENGMPAKVVAVLESEVVRASKVSMKFDRVARSNYYKDNELDITETFNGTGSLRQFLLKYAPVTSKDSYIVKADGIELLKDDYYVTVKSSVSRGFTSYYGMLVLETAPLRGQNIEIKYKISFLHLHALDRIHHYYNPEIGMVGKDFSQLMTGIDYGGVNIQGLVNFIGTGGWDSLGWNSELWGEENQQVTEDGSISPKPNDYDTQLVGGSFSFSSANGVNPEDIIVDGDDLITPLNSPAPEEVVPGHIVDAVAIKVFQAPRTSGAKILFKTFIANGVEDTFSIPQLPQNTNGIIVKLNSIILVSGDDYSYDWKSRSVKLTNIPVVNSQVSIISIGYSSEYLLDQDYFIGDGSTLEFITNAPFSETNGNIVLVDGAVLNYEIFETDISYSMTNRTGIRFGQAPTSGSVITYLMTNDENSTASIIKSETFVGDGSTLSFVLSNQVGNLLPDHSNVIVIVDGEILYPYLNEYFELSNNNLSYRLTQYEQVPYQVNVEQLKVYLNGKLLSRLTDYNVDVAGVSIILDSSLYIEGAKLLVSNNISFQYSLKRINSSLNLEFVSAPLNNKHIEVISFYNHDVLEIERSQESLTYIQGLDIDTPDFYRYRSLQGGKIKLSKKVNIDDFVWVIKNNKLLSSGIDFYLDTFKDQIILTASVDTSDIIDIVLFTSAIKDDGFGYMQFKDMLGRVHYKRFNKDKITRLSEDLTQFVTVIKVDDGSVLDEPSIIENIPGIIEINGERIEYFEKEGNELRKIRRATLGTGSPVLHKAGILVINIGSTETIPYLDQQLVSKLITTESTTQINLDFVPQVPNKDFESQTDQDGVEVFLSGQRVNKSSIVKFDKLKNYPYSPEADSIFQAGFTVPADGSLVEFQDPVVSNKEILVVKRIGRTWKDKDLPLIASNSEQARFILAVKPFYPEINI